MYTMAPQKKVPFAWCPPEALRHRKFSHASDVWSYGVTIWELFTFGEEPWVGCRAIDVLKNIDAGERLEKPKYCSERIYQIMNNCWKSNPAERCKFGTIREDLNSAFFLDAVAREGYNSIQPGALILAKGDEVVVVENTGQDWFGQNKKNQQFGTFPRSVVFAQTNHAVAAASAVTPQKVPTAPTIRMRPEPVIQAPPPLPFASKPLNNNTKTSYNDRTSRISMPVAGNDIIISNGNRSEETILIKAPERRDPTFDIRGNVLKPIPIEKVQPPTSSRPILVAPTASGVISMPLPEKFGTSQPHGSTVYVDKPDTSRNEPPRHNNSAGSRLENMGQPSFLNQQKQNIPNNLIPELQSRLNGGSDNMMRPRPASSIGILNNGMENAYDPQINRPFSVVNVPSMPQQPAQIPCLVPTPAPHQPRKSTNQEQNPLQKALADELKGNLSRRPTSGGNASNGLPRATQNGAGMPLSQPALQPQKVQQPVISQQPVVQKPIQQQPGQARPASVQPQQVKLPPPAATTATATTTTTSRPLAPPATESRKVSAPAPIAPTTTSATTSASSVVTRRSTQTITMSEEERRSRIIQDVASALPAPSALLLGSNSTSAVPSTTTQSAVRDRPVAAQVKPSQPQPTMPPKKTSEPILSTEVLQPTRVPSAASTPKPVSQPVPTPQPVRNPSPPVVQTRLAEKKPANPLAQSTNVPLFNITNSNMYPQLNNYPNYGNGYQPYGYGMNYNSGYPGVQGYNPYMSGMGQLALTNQAVNSLPPLVPSENRFSGSAQPLDESAINELLGAQNRQEASRVTPSAPVATPSAPSAPSTSYQNDLSMADRMEVLYKEADFTERGNCDTMVTHCKGDTELALKLLKQNHLMTIGVANTPDQARRALEARQYDLSAAANLLLG
ncbi:hypothetical protein L5515_016556 [Caenorhabditis briggsae]|uniref:Non-specific protein-tyrosine kinase n=1 Tax=Caenorhabditis briggsae TaxID=6238 RepID=A0AAE9FAZ1_CAEBR|nr:hypothetical protein L5515_016556 [Caenorhabditis briggsae]